MGSNGQTVRDIVIDSWKRKVVSVNGRGDPGLSIPADFAEEVGVEVGDDVAIVESDDQDGVLELHFEDDG